jgi:hypothetical protein
VHSQVRGAGILRVIAPFGLNRLEPKPVAGSVCWGVGAVPGSDPKMPGDEGVAAVIGGGNERPGDGVDAGNFAGAPCV